MFSQHTTWTHWSDPLPQRQAGCHWRTADRNLSARCTVPEPWAHTDQYEKTSHTHARLSPFISLQHYLLHQEIFRVTLESFFWAQIDRSEQVTCTSTLWKARETLKANRFCWSCQQRSTRGSKNVRHVWTSLSQFSAALRRRWGAEGQRGGGKSRPQGEGWEERGGMKAPPGRPSVGSKEDKAIRLGSPDSKVYWHLLITNRSLCIGELCQRSHPPLKLADSSCSVWKRAFE